MIRRFSLIRTAALAMATSVAGLCICACVCLCAGLWLPTPAAAQSYEWEPVSVPVAADGLGDYWLEVFFLPSNPRYGWVVGFNGHTLRTTDSGRTWQRGYVELKTRIGERVGHLEGVMFGDTLTGYCAGPLGLFKSTDGGRTWADTRDSAMVAGSVWSVFCTHPDSVFACGAGPSRNELRFHRSTNGGRTWSFFSASDPRSSTVLDMKLYSTAANGLGYATSESLVWRTQTGGRTWSVFSDIAQGDSTFLVSPWLEDLQNVGQSFLVPFDGNIAAIINGVGVVNAGASFSTDNGATWRKHISGKQMYGSWLLDERRGWAVGIDGTAIYTDDGGITWRDRTCGITNEADLDDVWFHNDRFGYVVGGTEFNSRVSKSRIYRFNPNARPPSRITPTRTRICRGDTLHLYAPAESQTYQWSNGETTEMIVVATAGTYSVRTCAGSSDTIRISVEDPPEARIAPSPNVVGNICSPESAQLFVARPLPAHRYRWQFVGENASAPVAQDTTVLGEGLTFTARRTGIYRLIAESPLGCTSFTTASVKILPQPNVTITAARPLRFCDGDSTTLVAPQGFRGYRWFRESIGLANGLPSGLPSGLPGAIDSVSAGQRTLVGTAPVLGTKISGRYFVEVTDSNGCIWFSNTLDVLGLNLPRQLFVASRLVAGSLRLDTTVVPRVACLDLRLVNVDSTVAVTIIAPFMAKNTEFSTPLSQFPLLVPPRSERVLTICFAPSGTGIRRDTLAVTDSCATTLIPLLGVGIGDTLEGTSRCNVVVRARVVGDDRPGVLLAVSQPSPNPVSTEITIAVESVIESVESAVEKGHSLSGAANGSATATTTAKQKPSCTLYTMMGTEAARADYKSVSTRLSGRMLIEEGECRADVRHLPPGAYLLVVRGADGSSVALPVAIQR